MRCRRLFKELVWKLFGSGSNGRRRRLRRSAPRMVRFMIDSFFHFRVKKYCRAYPFLFYLGDTGISIERAWLLLTMKSASLAAQPQQPSLFFFQAEVLGLARTCDKLAATIFVERNFHHTRVVELWGLFPAFCKRPSDLSSALPALTTTLARALEDSRYPQLVVCCGVN
jgi:hypothetical protein